MVETELSSSILVIIIGLTLTIVSSVKIECVPLENCSFATNLLSQGSFRLDVIEFLNLTRCGVEEKTKKTMVWCSAFTNCRTADYRNGTCIHFSKCKEFEELVVSRENQTAQNILNQNKCNLPNEPDFHLCCPWPDKKKQKTITPLRKKRNFENYPWHNPDPDNFFTGHQGHNHFHYNFHNHGNGFHNNHFHNHGNGFPSNRFSQEFQETSNTFENSFRNSSTNIQNNPSDQTEWFISVLLNNSRNIFNSGQPNGNSQFLDWWQTGKPNQGFNLTEETSFSVSETCLTPDNSEGRCKGIRQCETILDVLKKVNRTNYVEVDYLKKFQCPNIGSSNIKVCCSNNPIILPKSEILVKPIINDSSDGGDTIERNICGQQIIENKIIGGTTTDLGEFPWLALLEYPTMKGSRQFACGGSIISKRYIVTAAHCVDKDILKQAGLEILDRIILGEYDTRNTTDCIYTRYGNDCAAPSQSFNVETIIKYPLFRLNSTLHDIALIKVDKDITFSKYIRPICLPDATFRSLNNETFFISGWGRTETGVTSPIKRKARLQFVDKDNCNQMGTIGDGQMCLGSGKGVDSCKGDSGGPVMRTIASSGDSVSILIGIISYGFGRCGTTTSVCTYVPYYLDWISKNIF